MSEKENTRMRLASHCVTDTRSVVALLYMLAREHLPIGQIEAIIDGLETDCDDFRFTNGWLAEWAKDATGRLENFDREKEIS